MRLQDWFLIALVWIIAVVLAYACGALGPDNDDTWTAISGCVGLLLGGAAVFTTKEIWWRRHG